MAQVFKRTWTAKDGSRCFSENYYARFQVGGKDILRSTGESSKKAALRKMEEMIAESRQGAAVGNHLGKALNALEAQPEENGAKHGATIKALANELLERLVQTVGALSAEEQQVFKRKAASRLLSGVGETLELEEAWQTWLSNPNKGNPGPKTLSGYKGQWTRFKGWAAKNGIRYLHETSPALAEKYAADLWGSKVSPRTYNAHIKLLQGMFRTLRLSASIEGNPWQDIRQKEASTKSRRNLTPKELKTVCSKATGSMRYLIALGLYTGMRLGDCACLAWDAVDFKNGLISHVPMKTSRKGRHVRIPIHPVLDSLLRELRLESKGKYLFPAERKSYLHDSSLLSRRVKRFFKNTCKIETQEEKSGHRKNAVCRVGFHSLRHSFVSLCAANRVPQVAIMELVGHGSPAMTALYSHAGDEQKAKAITALPSVSFEPSDEPDETDESENDS